MRVIYVDNCKGCPWCQEVQEGFRMVWACTHTEFKGGVIDKKRNDNAVGKLKKDGTMPKTATHRVTAGCPLHFV